MPTVHLSPGMPAGAYWQDVCRGLTSELAARGLSPWAVHIGAPHAGTPDASNGGICIDRPASRVTISIDPVHDSALTASEQAFAWADDITLLVNGAPGEPP